MHFGASAVAADGRRRDTGDAAAHRPGAATKQMPPRRRAPGDPSKVYRLFPHRPLVSLSGMVFKT